MEHTELQNQQEFYLNQQKKISNDMEIFSNEILIDVIALNIDSASFTQIEEEAGHDVEKIKAKIKEIVAEKR